MKIKITRITMLVLFALSLSCMAEACRLWCAVGKDIPTKLIADQFVNDPQSLKSLGKKYQDGWSLGYYQDKNPIILRSDRSSFEDSHFNDAAEIVSTAGANIVVGHLRRASSGCVEGVANPHPFVQEANGKQWIFGHNGGMKKQILIDLIGQKYLRENPPTVCNHNPPESWIDSELYFIFLLKEIEQAGGNTDEGLNVALNKLYDVISEKNRYLNFFLSDGVSLWAFRKGTSLHYLEDRKKGLLLISSSIPDQNKNWQEFPEDIIVKLEQSKPIQFLWMIDPDRGAQTREEKILKAFEEAASMDEKKELFE